jgi:hypothetical protein
MEGRRKESWVRLLRYLGQSSWRSVRPEAAEPAGARRVWFDEIKDGGRGDREAGSEANG